MTFLIPAICANLAVCIYNLFGTVVSLATGFAYDWPERKFVELLIASNMLVWLTVFFMVWGAVMKLSEIETTARAAAVQEFKESEGKRIELEQAAKLEGPAMLARHKQMAGRDCMCLSCVSLRRLGVR